MSTDEPALPREDVAAARAGSLFSDRGEARRGSRSLVPSQARVVGWDGLALSVYFLSLLTLELQFFSGDTAFNFGNVIVCGGALLAAALIVGTRQRGTTPGITLTPQDYAFLLMVLYCGLSSAITPLPIVTLTQTAYLAFLALGAICLSRIPVEVAARWIVHAAFVITILSFLMIVVMPDRAFQPVSSTGFPELRGIFKHQLRLGLFLAIAFAFMVIAYFNGQARFVIHQKVWLAWIIFLTVFIGMIASMARSNVAFMLMTLPISMGLSRRGWIRWATLLAIVVITILIMTYADALMGLVAEDNGDVSLSGRVLIWQRTLAASAEAPWLGHGYASFDTYIYDFLWNVYRPPHAHNSFINAYFETGMVGVALLVLLILAQLVSLLRRVPVRRYSYALFLVVLAFFSSLMGVTYAGKPSIHLGLMLVFVAMETSTTINRRRIGGR